MPKLFIRAKLVYSLRTNKGWTIGELADKAGIHRTTIERIESGKISKPQARVLKKIADVFNVTTALLITNKEEMRFR